MKVNGSLGTYQLSDSALASGGEGSIYLVQSDANLVAKIYHAEKLNSDPELASKISYMVNNKPDKSVLDQIAWPMDVLTDNSNRFVGFTMPKLATDSDLKKIYPYPPKKEMPITNEQKLIIAINICIVISEIHKAGYVFGDFNPMNIGVNLSTGHVAFFDTDSYHFTDTQSGHTYRCGVGADGYIAPELIQHCHDSNSDFLSAPLPTFTKETDEFALAIHIFKLLMNGYTPFNGIKECESASQSSPGTGNIAIERDNYCFKPGNKPQSPATLELSSLTPDIQFLFKKTFLGGNKDPQSRATPEEWKNALIEYKDELKKCDKNPMHYYYVNNAVCPYCEADKKYQQSISQATQTYATGSSGNSQFGFSNPVNVPPTQQHNQQPNQYQNTYNQQKKKKTVKTVIRVLLWVLFFPIMVAIKIFQTHWPFLGKILAVCIVLSIYGSLLTMFGGVLSKIGNNNNNPGGTSTNDYSTVIDGDLKFTKTESGYSVSANPDSIASISGDVTIPSTCKELNVTSIAANAFEGCTNITSIQMPNSVTTIGDNAFENCTGLKTAVIPDTVVSIGYEAFYGCDKLEQLTIPFIGASEDAVGPNAVLGYIFGYQSEEKKVDEQSLVTEKVGDYLYTINLAPVERVGYTWQCTTYTDYSGWGTPTATFYYYGIPESLTSVTITKQTVIPAYAFNGCSRIQHIDYTADVAVGSTIGDAAFQNCTSLFFGDNNDGTLIIPDNYIKIGSNAFKGCGNIMNIVISDYIREIGHAAFQNCNQVSSIKMPFIGASEDAVGHNAVLGYIFGYQSEEKKVDKQSSVTEKVGDYLYTINLAPVERVGYTWQCTTYTDYSGWGTPTATFYYYGIPESLTSVTITKQTVIPAFAFNSCKCITKITIISSSVIGDNSFQGCDAEIIKK